MINRGCRKVLFACFGLLGLLIAVPAICATEDASANRDRQQETKAFEIETWFQQLLDSNDTTPTFTDYGDGFYALSSNLRLDARERLLSAAPSGDITKKAPQTLFVLATGQQLTPPSNPSVCIHASLSNANATYNYWVIVINLGAQNVTSTTTVQLAGPGLKFNKSVRATYGANGIWAIWYNPGAGSGKSGLYTVTATVAGGGSATTKSFAISQ